MAPRMRSAYSTGSVLLFMAALIVRMVRSG